MQQMNINSLILDYDLYPRSKVDTQHCGYMVESIKAGVELPPVIVDKKSKRVIDGFHRVTALQRYFKHNKGFTQDIPVILKTYKDDGTMFLDAMKFNASHGRALTQHDKSHCILKAEQDFALSIEDIQGALSITATKYDQLKLNVGFLLHPSPHLNKTKAVLVPKKTSRFSDERRQVVLKKTILHKAGQELTEEQVETNTKLSGASQGYLVLQLTELIENDLLDQNDVVLMEKVANLFRLLQKVIEK